MSTMSNQAQWIDEVRTRPGSMSQRKESFVAAWPGGVAALVEEARSKDVHLLRLTHDRGVALMAASVHSFALDNGLDWGAAVPIERTFELFMRGIGTLAEARARRQATPSLAETIAACVGFPDSRYWLTWVR